MRRLPILLVFLALAACARDSGPAATEFSVRITDPGTRPGREVTYEFPDDDWPTLHVIVEVNAVWSAGDRVDQPAPRLRGRFPVDVRTRPLPEGGATADIRIREPARGIPGCREFAGTIRWSDRGRIEALDLAVPDRVPPAARVLLEGLIDRISRLLPVLPESRIGVGARWKVVRPPEPDRPFVSITHCRLTQLRQNVMRVSVSMTRSSSEDGSPVAEAAGTMALTPSTFYLTGDETITRTEIRDVEDGEKHQRVRKVLTVRTVVAD